MIFRFLLLLTVASLFYPVSHSFGQSQLRPTAPSSDAIVRCEPVSTEGARVTVDIYVENVAELYGADVQMSFNTRHTQVVDAVPDSPSVDIELLDTFLSPDFVVRRTANNSQGTVWYAATQVNPSVPVTGSGSLARVTFVGLSVGDVSIPISSHELVRRNGTTIPSTPQDCTVNFTETETKAYLPFILAQ